VRVSAALERSFGAQAAARCLARVTSGRRAVPRLGLRQRAPRARDRRAGHRGPEERAPRTPARKFWANRAWLVRATIAFNLTRAAGTLASAFHAKATTGTIRAQLINVPARLARLAPQTDPRALPDRAPRGRVRMARIRSGHDTALSGQEDLEVAVGVPVVLPLLIQNYVQTLQN
jgi:hypothetical protein